jgi:hypothetical protein
MNAALRESNISQAADGLLAGGAAIGPAGEAENPPDTTRLP